MLGLHRPCSYCVLREEVCRDVVTAVGWWHSWQPCWDLRWQPCRMRLKLLYIANLAICSSILHLLLFFFILTSLAIRNVLCPAWCPIHKIPFLLSLYFGGEFECTCMRFLVKKLHESSAGNHYTLGSETTVMAGLEIIVFTFNNFFLHCCMKKSCFSHKYDRAPIIRIIESEGLAVGLVNLNYAVYFDLRLGLHVLWLFRSCLIIDASFKIL